MSCAKNGEQQYMDGGNVSNRPFSGPLICFLGVRPQLEVTMQSKDSPFLAKPRFYNSETKRALHPVEESSTIGNNHFLHFIDRKSVV